MTGLTFVDIANTQAALAATRKRQEVINIVAALLTKATASELAPLVYLLEGRLAPAYSPVRITFTSNEVGEAVALAYGVPTTRVAALASEGELGAATRDLAKGTDVLALLATYKALVALVTTTTDRVQRLSRLLTTAHPSAAEILVNLCTSHLRLGVGDATLLEAIASAGGNRNDRPELEAAYNRCADLGAVARAYIEHGLKGIGEITIAIGRPLMPMLAQRASSAQVVLAQLGEVAVEAKYNGLRVQVHKQGPFVQLFTRSLEEVTALYPEVVASIATDVSFDRGILEGELVLVNVDTGEFLPWPQVALHEPATSVTGPTRLFLFDLIFEGQTDLTNWTYIKRRERLEAVVSSSNTTLRLTPLELTTDAEVLERVVASYVADGLEGVVCKRPDGVYTPGPRSLDWLKLKRDGRTWLNDTVDCVVVGLVHGRGQEAALGAGALHVAAYDSDLDEYVVVARVGTGLSFAQLRDIALRLQEQLRDERPSGVRSAITPDRWVLPHLVVEVRADEVVALADGSFALRHPHLVGLRTDKLPTQATSVLELKEFYEQAMRRPSTPTGS